jgi:hypothetical protein
MTELPDLKQLTPEAKRIFGKSPRALKVEERFSEI